MKQKEGRTSTYVGEKPEMLAYMATIYTCKSTYIHSDNGNVFTTNGRDVLKDAGYKRFTSPSAIHQFVSVNDNKLHGAAKAEWRSNRLDFSDDVDSQGNVGIYPGQLQYPVSSKLTFFEKYPANCPCKPTAIWIFWPKTSQKVSS